MRWTKRKYKLKKRLGESKTVIRFLFVPKAIDEEVRWLEIVTIEKKIIEGKRRYYWKSTKFI
jgi:hypothetical protein